MRLTLILIIAVSFSLNAQQQVRFSLNDLQNTTRTFQELRGENLTLIDFWATWCRPCLKAIPELNRLYEIYSERGVSIIGINCDGPRSASKVLPLTRSLQIKYPVLTDMDADVMKRLNLSAYPSLVMTDGEGRVIWVHEGFVAGDGEIIRNRIEKELEALN